MQPAKKSALALLSTLVLSATPSLNAADAGPLPPPPELLDGAGYAIDAAPQPQNRPAPPPSRYGQAGGDAVPYYNPQRFPAGAPRQPGVRAAGANAPARPPMAISPPSHSMPEDYFNLPMLEEGIPGVLLPELDEDFVDPGVAKVYKRPIQPGMSLKDLQPYFDMAKGGERAALEAKKYGDDYLYNKNLEKAIAAYMDVIARADATSEAREEAWYGIARCEYRRENWWRAFDALERSFPGKYDRAEVAGRIKLEMFIGERLWRMGTQLVPESRKDGNLMTGYQAADRVYTAALINNPGARDAPIALLRRGDAAAMHEEWADAAKFYRSVVQFYPESEPAMQARSALAEAVLRQEHPAGFPQAAREELGNVMGDVEGSERKLSDAAETRRQRAVTLANDQEAGEKLRHAKEYMKGVRLKKSRDAAVFLLGDIVSHYPNTPQAREASELLLSLGIEPPMVLSGGTRFPLKPGQSGDLPDTGGRGAGGGSVQVGGQSDTRSNTRQGNTPYSPTPAYTPAPGYSAVPQEPVDIAIPGVTEIE